ncbi:serine/threonine protein phosphatase [Rhodotorula toruloides]|uniref:Serine/threonine protein phosphatase n=1 Tax=Rhodotorula toruloides TaxID=5286 RepID=A0A511KE87_RHOTO|nr:serine/threonine protein phosphatase [Rhodotorula toruloides]
MVPLSSNRSLLLLTFALFGALLYLARSPSSDVPHKAHRVLAKPRPIRQNGLVNQEDRTEALAELEGGQGRRILRQRIVAMGDIHGDLPAATKILRRAEVIDLKGQWTGGDTILVQTGDIVDRGPDTIVLYRFLQSLRPQAERAGGAVASLLGNHEMMNCLGDYRYVTKEDIASFGGERNRRDAFLHGWIGQEFRANYSIMARVPYLIEDYPTSLDAPVLPATPSGASDRRFIADPTFAAGSSPASDPLRRSAISFVHGGITPEYLASLSSDSPISDINRIGHSILQSLLSVPGGVPLGLPRTASPEQKEFWSERGPMWNRDWALEEEDEICERVEKALEMLNVRRMVMGHTPQFEGILSRCDGKILLIDTGISRAYGGAHSSLSLTYTLTPASALTVSDALSLGLVDLQDADPETTLKSDEMSRTWVEKEVVEALYTAGRATEVLDERERVVKIP